jgi:hypothetical protein
MFDLLLLSLTAADATSTDTANAAEANNPAHKIGNSFMASSPDEAAPLSQLL